MTPRDQYQSLTTLGHDPLYCSSPRTKKLGHVNSRVATKNLRRFLERLIKESIIKGEG